MRKKLFYTLIAVFIIQLLVPVYMIGYSLSFQNKLETEGKEYYIRIEPYGVNDKNEVTFYTYGCEYFKDNESLDEAQYIYALLDLDPEGIAYVKEITYEKPETPYYIKTDKPYIDWIFPSMSYKTDEFTGDALTKHINKYDYYSFNKDNPNSYDTYYARILVYKGKIIVKEILINDTPIEEYFRN